MPAFKPLKKPSLYWEVENYLRDAIAKGRYKPGEKLPSENELVKQFKVSRPTIREALKNLQCSGLIIAKRGAYGGSYVSELNPYPITRTFNDLVKFNKINFVHLLDVRLYIEPETASLAAICRTNKEIEILTKLLDRAAKYAENSCKKARLTNNLFHLEVAKLTKNPIIIFIVESITQVYTQILIEMTGNKLDKKGVIQLINDHRDILDSITKKNSNEAYQKSKRHIINIYNMYCEFIHNISPLETENIENHIQLIKKQ